MTILLLINIIATAFIFFYMCYLEIPIEKRIWTDYFDDESSLPTTSIKDLVLLIVIMSISIAINVFLFCHGYNDLFIILALYLFFDALLLSKVKSMIITILIRIILVVVFLIGHSALMAFVETLSDLSFAVTFFGLLLFSNFFIIPGFIIILILNLFISMCNSSTRKMNEKNKREGSNNIIKLTSLIDEHVFFKIYLVFKYLLLILLIIILYFSVTQ